MNCSRSSGVATSGAGRRAALAADPLTAPPLSWRISMSASPRPRPWLNCTASWSSAMSWYMSPWSLPNIGSPKLALRMLSSIILVNRLSNCLAAARSVAGSSAGAAAHRRELLEVVRIDARRVRHARAA